MSDVTTIVVFATILLLGLSLLLVLRAVAALTRANDAIRKELKKINDRYDDSNDTDPRY